MARFDASPDFGSGASMIPNYLSAYEADFRHESKKSEMPKMKSIYLLATAALSSTRAAAYSWAPAGPGDVRAPCPMLNSLANHGILPHDGKDITLNQTIDALGSALNIDSELSIFLHEQAITTNPTPNATTFSLDDLGRHDILEHDGSFSRPDFYFGNVLLFNETIFNETRAYWTGDMVDVQMAANSRLARMRTSRETNPTFTLSELGEAFSAGEAAAYLIVLGDDATAAVAPKARVEYLFENERLPLELGWKRSTTTISIDLLADVIERIRNATFGSIEPTTTLTRRRTLDGSRRRRIH
ncbi:Chloroperoxidase [Camillea tinctor]|nr:Chloroperoxidase [Camillea tinctor]